MVKVINFMLGIFPHNFKKWILLIRHCSAWTVHHSAVLDTDNPIPLNRDAILGHLVGGEELEGRPVPLPRENSTVPVGTLSMRAAMDTHYHTWFSSVCTHYVLLCLTIDECVVLFHHNLLPSL